MAGVGAQPGGKVSYSLACRLVETVELLIQTLDPITIRGMRLTLL